MADIIVDSEFRRKLKDGSYKIYHPITKAKNVKLTNGQDVESSLTEKASQTDFDNYKKNYVANNAFATTSGTSTAYTVTLNPAPTAYVDGMSITIVPNVDCGASPTLNINSLGAVQLLKTDGTNFTAGELKAGKPYSFVRVGSNFFIRSFGGGANFAPVQRGTTTIVYGEKYKEIQVNPVNAANTVVLVTAAYPTSTTGRLGGMTVIGYMTNNTTLALSRYDELGAGFNVSWEIYEIKGVKSFQKGFATIDYGINDVKFPISQVDMSKTILLYNYKINSTSAGGNIDAGYLTVMVNLEDSNNIRAYRYFNGYTFVLNWYLIEFN